MFVHDLPWVLTASRSLTSYKKCMSYTVDNTDITVTNLFICPFATVNGWVEGIVPAFCAF
jgi:hypothetical protein